ncbi:MAG: Ig-like domain-containing protein [bacterium]|nr:Ig-like domain-containing protein [bacterium]
MKYFIVAISAFLFSSCANMVVPNGGKKDEKTPILLKTNLRPLNFNERVIKLQFDEYIVLNEPINNITIQPKHSTYKIDMLAKTISIKLDSALKENTTYTLSIDKGIKDVHEDNTYSFNYSFSTGNQLDTNFTEYNIIDFKKYSNLKIGLTNHKFDSLTKLKFDYLYNIKTSLIRVNGLNSTPYKVWIFTDNNADNIPDEFKPIYYDTFLINSSKTIVLDNWINSSLTKEIKYNLYTKVFKQLNNVDAYPLDQIIYIDIDSSLFYNKQSDSLPSLDIKKEISAKISQNIKGVKTNKEYLITVEKYGIRNIIITDKIKYTEDNNYLYIESKSKIDSINFKYKNNNDSFVFYAKVNQYTESNKLSLLRLRKSLNNDTIIMVAYKDDKRILTKLILLNKEQIFYFHPGLYYFEFFKSSSFDNLSFNIKKLKRISSLIIKKEIMLKPNWDEDLQLIF